jgi:hypothetical protein
MEEEKSARPWSRQEHGGGEDQTTPPVSVPSIRRRGQLIRLDQRRLPLHRPAVLLPSNGSRVDVCTGDLNNANSTPPVRRAHFVAASSNGSLTRAMMRGAYSVTFSDRSAAPPHCKLKRSELCLATRDVLFGRVEWATTFSVFSPSPPHAPEMMQKSAHRAGIRKCRPAIAWLFRRRGWALCVVAMQPQRTRPVPASDP